MGWIVGHPAGIPRFSWCYGDVCPSLLLTHTYTHTHTHTHTHLTCWNSIQEPKRLDDRERGSGFSNSKSQSKFMHGVSTPHSAGPQGNWSSTKEGLTTSGAGSSVLSTQYFQLNKWPEFKHEEGEGIVFTYICVMFPLGMWLMQMYPTSFWWRQWFPFIIIM